jgi:hypothetical protein
MISFFMVVSPFFIILIALNLKGYTASLSIYTLFDCTPY